MSSSKKKKTFFAKGTISDYAKSGSTQAKTKEFNDKYDEQIRKIGTANNVDMSTAKDMFTANLNNSMMGIQADPYKGGGVVNADDWNKMVDDWSDVKKSATESVNQKDRTTTNSYGRSINTSDLLLPSANTTGTGDPRLDAILRQAEQAELMLELGCYNSASCDGGGSSCMVMVENNKPKIVNKPSEGTERSVGSVFVVYKK